jgi:hypothetical protein
MKKNQKTLISLEKEIKSYENEIYEIDRMVIKHYSKMTLSEVLNQKKQIKYYEGKIRKNKQLILNGKYVDEE